MSLAERIKTARGPLSKRSFAHRIGIVESTLGNYEQGQSLPNVDVAARICTEFGVSPEWLLMGTGPMRVGEGDAPSESKMVASELNVELLRQVLSTFDDFLKANGFPINNHEKYIIGGGIYNAIVGEKDSSQAALKTIHLLREAFVNYRVKPQEME